LSSEEAKLLAELGQHLTVMTAANFKLGRMTQHMHDGESHHWAIVDSRRGSLLARYPCWGLLLWTCCIHSYTAHATGEQGAAGGQLNAAAQSMWGSSPHQCSGCTSRRDAKVRHLFCSNTQFSPQCNAAVDLNRNLIVPLPVLYDHRCRTPAPRPAPMPPARVNQRRMRFSGGG